MILLVIKEYATMINEQVLKISSDKELYKLLVLTDEIGNEKIVNDDETDCDKTNQSINDTTEVIFNDGIENAESTHSFYSTDEEEEHHMDVEDT